MITAPAAYLDGCKVLAYAVVPPEAEFTGRLRLNVAGAWLGRVPCLAICEWNLEPELLVLHCSDEWEVLGLEGWNARGVPRPASVEAVIALAERNYRGLASAWVHVAAYEGHA